MSDEPYSTEALASRCGVAVRTIHRWRKEPDFPPPVVERGRDDGLGHDWSFTDVRSWLDGRGEWDWAMDRAFSADTAERKARDPGAVEKLIDAALTSESARVRAAAKRASQAVDRLRRELVAEEQRREARAEVERLTRELGAAKARLRTGHSPAISPANSRWRESQSNREAIRDWARSQGIHVMDRGAISLRVVKLYNDAHQAPPPHELDRSARSVPKIDGE
jgi:hypothetical protein